MASRLVILDASTLPNLLTHYSEGQVPVGAELKQVLVSKYLQRWIALVLESDSWEGTELESAGYGHAEPYFFKYEGKRVMNWTDKHSELTWSASDAIESPRRT